MKSKIYNYSILFFVCAVAMVFMRCTSDDKAVKIYMPEGKSIVSSNFDITDTVTYSATIVGADYPTVSLSAGREVTIDFKVDADKVSSFNQSMGTNYTLLSSDNYSFDASATIEKGKFSTTPLKLIIKNGDMLDPFSSYLLPISIDKVNGADASDVQRTTYFVITRSPSVENLPAYDRSDWAILNKSTEEPAEGGGNGLAIDAIDSNYDSYWHTQWSGGEPGPPHYISIDMGEEKVIHGISIVDRSFEGDWAVNGHGQPKTMTISVSTDGVNWNDNGSFQVPIKEPQAEIRFFLPTFKSARYFRITVTSVWATNSTSIAEIYAL
jgi:hypothetical protein